MMTQSFYWPNYFFGSGSSMKKISRKLGNVYRYELYCTRTEIYFKKPSTMQDKTNQNFLTFRIEKSFILQEEYAKIMFKCLN